MGSTLADLTELEAIIREAEQLQHTVTDRQAQKLLQNLLDVARRIVR